MNQNKDFENFLNAKYGLYGEPTTTVNASWSHVSTSTNSPEFNVKKQVEKFNCDEGIESED